MSKKINIILFQPEISPNTGNIIRTCYSIGAKLHIINPISFKLHPKWMKRPAAGKHLSDIEHEVHKSYEAFFEKYSNANIFYVSRYATQTHSSPNYKEINNNVFFMFGRESTGIPNKIIFDNMNKAIRIPMTPLSRSLNLANCVAIVAYEALRQLDYPKLSKTEVIKGKDWIEKNH